MTKKFITDSFLLYSSDEGWFRDVEISEIQEFAELFYIAVRSALRGDSFLRAKCVFTLCEIVVEMSSKELFHSDVQYDLNVFINRLLVKDALRRKAL